MAKRRRAENRQQAEEISRQPESLQPENAGILKDPGRTLTYFNLPTFRLSLLFSVYMMTFHVLLWLFSPEKDYLGILIAKLVAALVTFGGIEAVANSNTIAMPNARWVVVPECTAINVFILFVSFVLAYTASPKLKALAIGLGVPFVFISNIGRLVSLAWITDRYPQYAEWIHAYVWQGAFLLMVVLMWLAWIEYLVKHEC